jgi:hypothetical protein
MIFEKTSAKTKWRFLIQLRPFALKSYRNIGFIWKQIAHTLFRAQIVCLGVSA